MMRKAYLMPFDELVKMLVEKGQKSNLPSLLNIQSLQEVVQSNLQESPAYQECKERYENTWWEVIWPAGIEQFSTKRPECIYIADSLQDAMRRKPTIDITFWSCSPREIQNYLNQVEDWSEDLDWFDHSENVEEVAIEE